ncbi:MAG TPA: c-type cytochrome, partial [Prosthecobacter sp.]
GTDGKTLQHRGGGVIRVRPDGSGLEIYSTGTRNILEVAISPTMDIFARDNTNDGGGWNVRFHHFTGLDDHGYPRLYKNFNDEAVQPLADYGGGSGCGAVYIDEPGFGAWNNAPFTADWGTGAIWHHQVKPKGATFEETRKPEPFIKMTRPTDADVDGMGHVYASSWKGATFNWEGPDVGYIVRVAPKGFRAEALPDFATLSDADLVKQLESPSYRRRMDGQRELMRRNLPDASIAAMRALMMDGAKPIFARAAACLAFTRHTKKTVEFIGSYQPEANDIHFGAVAARLIAELVNSTGKALPGTPEIPEACKSPASLVQLNRLMSSAPEWSAEALKLVFGMTLGDADPIVRHTAVRALASLNAHSVGLAFLDDHIKAEVIRSSALRALAMMHKPEVVEGLISRLAKATDTPLRQGILSTLCRLHFHEGEWKGDSWGTRPDTRGPYYQPEPWAETSKIAAALKDALAKATPEEAAFLVKEMNRNRIQSNDALERILALAKQDAKVLPDAVAQLAVAETIPADAVPLLVSSLGLPPAGGSADGLKPAITLSSATLSQAIVALTKTDSAEGVTATLATLPLLQKMPESQKDYEAATAAFFNSPKLENHHLLVEQAAEKLDGATSRTADAALLYLANRNSGSPESKELSGKAIEHGWQADPKRRIQIIDAIASVKHQASAPRVLVALDDPDPKVKAAAERAAKTMKIQKVEDKTPKIATLEPAAALEAVVKTKGDVVLGEQIFARATCVACHTTKESEAQKGPYLGNIAQTYKRADLAQNILDPNKTIAQGFASELILTKDGAQQMGFITLESATEVKLRNIAAQEFTFKTADIKERQKLPMSMMPPGLMMNFTVREFASLLDYLEALSKK